MFISKIFQTPKARHLANSKSPQRGVNCYKYAVYKGFDSLLLYLYVALTCIIKHSESHCMLLDNKQQTTRLEFPKFFLHIMEEYTYTCSNYYSSHHICVEHHNLLL